MIPTMLCHEPTMAEGPHAFGGPELASRARLSRGFDARAATLLHEMKSNSTRHPCRADEPEAPRQCETQNVGGAEEGAAQAADDAARLVVLAEEPRRRGASSLIREPPAQVRDVRSEEELRRYSVDALRKMAKTCGLDLARGMTRDKVIAELSAFMSTQQWLEPEIVQTCSA